jgi:hypothetical protein
MINVKNINEFAKVMELSFRSQEKYSPILIAVNLDHEERLKNLNKFYNI